MQSEATIMSVGKDLSPDWCRRFYDKIVLSLGFSPEKDKLARNILRSLLSLKGTPSFSGLARSLRREQVSLVLGASPGLVNDLGYIKNFIFKNRPLLVAADGAADALFEQLHIAPDAIISDLDSCSFKRLLSQTKKGILLAHAHGDNIPLVLSIVPKLGKYCYGTTQVESLGNVLNLGGFTDGDRAAYFAAKFTNRAVVMVGMDFENREGLFSRNRYGAEISRNTKQEKLRFAKRSLEFLIEETPELTFVDVSSGRGNIAGAEKIIPAELNRVLSSLC